MDMPYIEKDCVIRARGSWRTFEACGAIVTPEVCIGYLKNPDTELLDRVVERVGTRGVLTDWHGNPLGTYRIVAVWRTPHSTVSSVMCQVEATVGGVVYTGRSAGYGMLYRGKRKANSLLLATIEEIIREQPKLSYLRDEMPRIARNLRRIRKDPGDLAPLGEPYFVGFAIAENMTGKGPGWIPVCQERGCRYGDMALVSAQSRALSTTNGETP